MLEKKIIDIFYNKVIPKAGSEDPFFIDSWKYFIDFNTIILEEEKVYRNPNTDVTLYIQDKEKLNSLLVEYTLKQILEIQKSEKLRKKDDLYFDGNLDFTIESILWYNMHYAKGENL